MTSGERLPKSSGDDSSKKIVGYCGEGVRIKSEDRPASEEFAEHVEGCSQCSVILETENDYGAKDL